MYVCVCVCMYVMYDTIVVVMISFLLLVKKKLPL
jgi:hypothetical protein